MTLSQLKIYHRPRVETAKRHIMQSKLGVDLVIMDIYNHLFMSVANVLSEAADLPFHKQRPLYWRWWDGPNPKCFKHPEGDSIFLCRGNYVNAIYQFAHEFTHHIHLGSPSRTQAGIIWFEEIICSVASAYAMHHPAVGRAFVEVGLRQYREVLPAVARCLCGLSDNTDILDKGILLPHISYLSRCVTVDGNARQIVDFAASRTYPLFAEYPSLFRLAPLLYAEQWDNLGDFLSYAIDANRTIERPVFLLRELLIG